MASQSSLQDFVERHRRLFVLTGAGCSTRSGIPDYRGVDGAWKRTPPVSYQAFMGEEATRRRYWARSLVGWRRFRLARPNDAHRALARLEASGKSELLLTQNVDRLHQAAGSARVIDLHGRLDLCPLHGLRAENVARRPAGRARPPQRRLVRSRGRRRAGRRRRSRGRRLLVFPDSVLPALRRRAQAGCGVFRRERSARPGRGGAAASRRRPTPC